MRFFQAYLFGIFVLIISLAACNERNDAQQTGQAPSLSPYQRMALTYFSYPQFVHPAFNEQLVGLPLRVETYDAQGEKLYFSASKASVDTSAIAQLAIQADSITFAEQDSAGFWLDSQRFSDSSRWYFSLSPYQLQIDSTRELSLSLGGVTYQATLAEITQVFVGNMMYNGPAIAQTNDRNARGQAYVVGNHCATIALTGEPSLQRLAYQLVDTSESVEQQVQDLLDFVTGEISYTGDAGMEIFRRPTEVLLSQTADCSGKVVLFASLLGQINYPYLLVYFRSHITIAVPGDFSDKNGMHFEHEGQRLYFAETTSKGFVIGQSRLFAPLREADIQFLQYPGKRTKLYDVKRKDSLAFVQR